MKIYITSDHRGFVLKNKLKLHLIEEGYSVVDLGNYVYEGTDDYPDYGKYLANRVAKDHNSFGVALCGSGAGMCMVVNRTRGVRGVLAHDITIAKASRHDDDANILCFGADLISFQKAKKILSLWLSTRFAGSKRFIRRIKKLDSRS